MKIERFDLPVIAREASVLAETVNTEERTIDVVWTTGAVVQRVRWEGWDVVEYDEELEVSPQAIRLGRLNDGAPFLDSHRSWGGDSVIGSVVPGSVRIEGGRGTAKIRLTSAPDAAGIVHRILERTINKVSVGYRVHRYEVKPAEKRGERDVYRAVDWEPYEISAVAMPADAGATIRSGKADQPSLFPCVIGRSAAAAAQSKGQDMTGTNTAPAAGDESRTTPSVTPPAAVAPVAPSADEIRAEERLRVSTITSLCGRHGIADAVRDQLIKDGVSLDKARATILDSLVETDTAGRTSEHVPAAARGASETDVKFRDGLTNALLHRADPGKEKLTSDGRDFRGLTLLDMARTALERMGISTRGMSKMELAAAVFQSRAGVGFHSTSDFPAILANVANKTLLAAYDSTPRTFGVWARRATITDFKPVQRTKLGGAPDLELVKEAGEFSYGTIDEGKEVYGLLTYGRIISITRQTLINDDLDAFTRVPAAFGASAADLESDIVYSILMSNPEMGDELPLFGADHGNLLTASGITEDALSEVYRKFAEQRGLEGRRISVVPRYLLVPPGERAVQARKQLTATTPGSTAEVNPYANRMQVVEEPRLIPEDAADPDPWFVIADPSRIDTVEYAYLDGQEGVFTETRMGFEVDGMEIKARHDFAAKAIDWKGMQKNPGIGNA